MGFYKSLVLVCLRDVCFVFHRGKVEFFSLFGHVWILCYLVVKVLLSLKFRFTRALEEVFNAWICIHIDHNILDI